MNAEQLSCNDGKETREGKQRSRVNAASRSKEREKSRRLDRPEPHRPKHPVQNAETHDGTVGMGKLPHDDLNEPVTERKEEQQEMVCRNEK